VADLDSTVPKRAHGVLEHFDARALGVPAKERSVTPRVRASRCSGSAIRLPNPPLGMWSWLGNSRSYESNDSSWRAAIVSVST
jgi:hypothetical protein